MEIVWLFLGGIALWLLASLWMIAGHGNHILDDLEDWQPDD